jgi:hypothetical protein
MMWGVLQAAGNPNAYDITTWVSVFWSLIIIESFSSLLLKSVAASLPVPFLLSTRRIRMWIRSPLLRKLFTIVRTFEKPFMHPWTLPGTGAQPVTAVVEDAHKGLVEEWVKTCFTVSSIWTMIDP